MSCRRGGFRAPFFLTIACESKATAKEVASKLSSHYIQTQIHDDVIGVEYAAMLKNIYAIAAGISHGLGYGDTLKCFNEQRYSRNEALY